MAVVYVAVNLVVCVMDEGFGSERFRGHLLGVIHAWGEHCGVHSSWFESEKGTNRNGVEL